MIVKSVEYIDGCILENGKQVVYFKDWGDSNLYSARLINMPCNKEHCDIVKVKVLRSGDIKDEYYRLGERIYREDIILDKEDVEEREEIQAHEKQYVTDRLKLNQIERKNLLQRLENLPK